MELPESGLQAISGNIGAEMRRLPKDGGFADGFLRGCADCIPTVPGYLSIGFSAGALAKVAGMSEAEIVLMSLLLYAGSAQFVVAGMLLSGALGVTIVLSVFFVNLRHLLMSAYLAPFFRQGTPTEKAMP